MKLSTVNVIETVDGTPLSLRSFSDRKTGNIEAEALFTKLVKEHETDTGFQWSDEDIGKMIEDGIYDDNCGYNLFLTHSS